MADPEPFPWTVLDPAVASRPSDLVTTPDSQGKVKRFWNCCPPWSCRAMDGLVQSRGHEKGTIGNRLKQTDCTFFVLNVITLGPTSAEAQSSRGLPWHIFLRNGTQLPLHLHLHPPYGNHAVAAQMARSPGGASDRTGSRRRFPRALTGHLRIDARLGGLGSSQPGAKGGHRPARWNGEMSGKGQQRIAQKKMKTSFIYCNIMVSV